MPDKSADKLLSADVRTAPSPARADYPQVPAAAMGIPRRAREPASAGSGAEVVEGRKSSLTPIPS